MTTPTAGQRLRRGQPRWIGIPVIAIVVIGGLTRGDRGGGWPSVVGLGVMLVLAVVVVVGLTVSRRGAGR